jgi:serine/threonine-protein kinase HipA
MRAAEVFYNKVKAGMLTAHSNRSFTFRYNDEYYLDPVQPMISLTLPKSKQEYQSPHLFPFFFNLIAEGANLSLQSRYLKIDTHDYFGILCATAHTDSIGAVTVKLIPTT